VARTTVPLVFMVDPDLMDQPDFVALRAQGHEVRPLALDNVDLVLSVKACRFEPAMLALPLLDRLIKLARAAKKQRRLGGKDD
jgi:hypothetical protein